ncbi:hypothetical protein OEA41_007841 [Lepraria neglecta]|uniref:GATA-type domain-containing protein n=1 Tax=Lepraria neglecta TaxID=209136 RepID=A0AAE0DNB2_9LECA|nr:hypothetical protein OEA41_007841 [Lepraria neglecta]
MATLTDHGHNLQPVCQNCTTSTTPLWRRDEMGSVLCNACGLFLKLHGTPRPISLKTDVIKSRNRVKTAGQGQKRKSLFDGNGLPASQSETGTPPPNHMNNRRVSHKTSSGGSGGSNSPISRTETPALHPNIAPQHIFDRVSLADLAFQSPALPSLHLRQPSPGSTSSFNDRNLEPPQTYEGLLQANSSLKTRVNELEVINDLYRGTVTQYEQGGAPQAEMIPRDSESQLKQHLEQALRSEEALKRQVEDLEREVAELRGEQPPLKRSRLSDGPKYPEPPQGFANGLHS